jgi:ATP-binding protein involved in chromosome partitioning
MNHINKFQGKIILPGNVTEILRSVRFPGSSKDIVGLDMVQEIRIAGRNISFSLVFDQPGDPAVSELVALCEKTIMRGFGPDTGIIGNITVRYRQDMERPVLPEVRNIIAVASGKGGVGKSTVAVNLAIALANAGFSTGLIDADIFGPSVPKMFGVEGIRPVSRHDGKHHLIVPVEKFGVKMLSMGFFVDPGNALIWRGPMASNALKQLIIDGDWGKLDYLLVDLPPGTSDIHLTLVQTVAVTAAIIVTTPQEVALADVIKGVSMFRSNSVNVPVLGLVENMSWFTPAELPENKYYIFGKEGGKKLAEEMGLVLLGEIPIIQGICEGGDNGMPVAADPGTMTGMAFTELASRVAGQINIRNSNFQPTQKVFITRK